jgi:hypothetical protein
MSMNTKPVALITGGGTGIVAGVARSRWIASRRRQVVSASLAILRGRQMLSGSLPQPSPDSEDWMH